MKTWFITGTSRGLGRVWARAALERGDLVAATARDPGSLDDLVAAHGDRILPLRLDVTDRRAGTAAVQAAHERFGRLDVVVNNAGYGQFGMVEEITEAEARAQLETNFFGTLWITQAALPLLRAQRSGHLVQVSSVGGVTAYPEMGMYHASRWALEGLTQSLRREVQDFGVAVTLVEPGGFRTDAFGSSARHSARLPDYAEVRRAVEEERSGRVAHRGDPEATAAALFAIVDAPAPPLRVLLGDGPLEIVVRDYESRLAEWRAWQPVSLAAAGSTDTY